MKNKIFGVLAVIGTMLVIVSGGQESIAKILVLGGVGLVMMLPGAIYSGTRYYDISEINGI